MTMLRHLFTAFFFRKTPEEKCKITRIWIFFSHILRSGWYYFFTKYNSYFSKQKKGIWIAEISKSSLEPKKFFFMHLTGSSEKKLQVSRNDWLIGKNYEREKLSFSLFFYFVWKKRAPNSRLFFHDRANFLPRLKKLLIDNILIYLPKKIQNFIFFFNTIKWNAMKELGCFKNEGEEKVRSDVDSCWSFLYEKFLGFFIWAKKTGSRMKKKPSSSCRVRYTAFERKPVWLFAELFYLEEKRAWIKRNIIM